MDNNQYYFDAYFDFINFVDERIAELEKIHSKNLICKKKCCFCCMNTTVLPIEFFSILSKIKLSGKKPELTNESCAFLKNSLCQIYPIRPLICRTHGLLLAYGKDDDPLAKDVTFCELNFTKSIPKLTEKNVLDMDELNIELVRLNEKFLKSYDGDLPERMELSDIIKYL
jgi:uncharacterized protein